MRNLIVVAFALALAGCFSSDGPVFEAARGQCPFTSPVTYEEVDPNGESYRFVFETDGPSCKTTDPDGKITHSLFVPIGREWWIVQGDEARPTYALIHRAGARLVQYLPNCKDFSAPRLRRLGVEFDQDRGQCTVTTARQVETLFRSWRSPFRRASGAYREVRE